MTNVILDDLRRRGLVKQTTGDLTDLFKNPVTFYVGFDPTADSLHVGHLIAAATIKRLADAGHKPVILIGDATARVGDPSGKRAARPMLRIDEIQHNALQLDAQLRSLVPGWDVAFVRNSEWLGQALFLDFVRDVGSQFSVNVMLRAECFKARLEEGLSFLELSYMLMQAADFAYLHEAQKVSLQIGGDDQWSNILAGCDLIRRMTGDAAHGLTLPLLVNADGTKMGKTEKGTVWLKRERTSVFDFFQFWRNIPDDKVRECFMLLSFAPVEEILALQLTEPAEINAAKKRLATEITAWVHGADAAKRVLEQVEAMFEAGDMSAARVVEMKNGVGLLTALVECGMAKSLSAARSLVLGGGIYVDGQRVLNHAATLYRWQSGDEAVLRKGKKEIVRVRLV